MIHSDPPAGRPDTAANIDRFLKASGWIPAWEGIRFLAAGEYNENYLVSTGAGEYVFRINHGSQLGLDNQIEYEYRVLEAVFPSGVTPEPLAYALAAEGFPRGVLLMEFLPGRPFNYSIDLPDAATVFSRVHALPPVPGLIVQEEPVRAIAEESLSLLGKYPDHPLTTLHAKLSAYHAGIVRLAEDSNALFRGERLCIVNTEVNSGNFIKAPDRVYLVDWEKAVVSYRYQDLGHFLVPTTTLWKTDFIVSREERIRFLERYAKTTGENIPAEELDLKTRVLEKTIILRALAWCYMAFFEYTESERVLRNDLTLTKIRKYVDEADFFLHYYDSGTP